MSTFFPPLPAGDPASPANELLAQAAPDDRGKSGGNPKKDGPDKPDVAGVARGSTVARVQKALKNRGFYTGVADGDAGPDTRKAILEFREANGLPPSMKIDVQLLRTLGL